MATDIEGIWREKSDDDLIEAAGQLADYTPEGQRVIRLELKRRGLEDPLEQAGEASAADEEALPPRECSQCHAELRYLSVDEGEGVGRPLQAIFGSSSVALLRQLFQDHPLDVCICPQCGHIDLFVNADAALGDQAAPERERP